MSETFGKEKRLLRSEDFKEVFSFSHSQAKPRRHIHRGAFFTLYWKPHSDVPRLGMSLAKKVIRRANTRNRIKRCLREYFRTQCSDLHADIIVKFTSAPKKMTFEDLTKPLQTFVRLQQK